MVLQDNLLSKKQKIYQVKIVQKYGSMSRNKHSLMLLYPFECFCCCFLVVEVHFKLNVCYKVLHGWLKNIA